MNADTMAHRIIAELARIQDRSPTLLSEAGWGLDIWDLAVRASILSLEETRLRRERCLAGTADDMPAVQTLIVERGWASARSPGPHGNSAPALYPTPAGIDYVHRLKRPQVRKSLGSLRGIARVGTISVAAPGFLRGSAKVAAISVVTTAVTAVATYYVLRLLESL